MRLWSGRDPNRHVALSSKIPYIFSPSLMTPFVREVTLIKRPSSRSRGKRPLPIPSYHPTSRLQVLAPRLLKGRLPGFAGPVPPPLWIRVALCTLPNDIIFSSKVHRLGIHVQNCPKRWTLRHYSLSRFVQKVFYIWPRKVSGSRFRKEIYGQDHMLRWP